jgi:membrane protease YdiL (CAAX protease family)
MTTVMVRGMAESWRAGDRSSMNAARFAPNVEDMSTETLAPPRMRAPLAVRAVLTVVALFVAELAGGLLAAPLPQLPAAIAGSAGVALAGLGLAIVLVRLIDRRPIGALRLGLDRTAARWSVIALAAVAGSVVAGTLLATALGLTHGSPAPRGSLAFAIVMIVLQAFILQGIPEELLFRGYLVQTALGRLGPWGVLALSSLLFGSIHLVSQSGATTLTQRLLFLLIPIGFGAMATVVRIRAGSVWPAVAVHGGFHVTNFVVTLFVTPAQEKYGLYLAVVGGVLLVSAAIMACGIGWRSRS